MFLHNHNFQLNLLTLENLYFLSKSFKSWNNPHFITTEKYIKIPKNMLKVISNGTYWIESVKQQDKLGFLKVFEGVIIFKY